MISWITNKYKNAWLLRLIEKNEAHPLPLHLTVTAAKANHTWTHKWDLYKIQHNVRVKCTTWRYDGLNVKNASISETKNKKMLYPFYAIIYLWFHANRCWGLQHAKMQTLTEKHTGCDINARLSAEQKHVASLVAGFNTNRCWLILMKLDIQMRWLLRPSTRHRQHAFCVTSVWPAKGFWTAYCKIMNQKCTVTKP